MPSIENGFKIAQFFNVPIEYLVLGKSIYIEFQKPITIDEIRIMPGCFLKKYFIKNYRIKSLDIILDGKIVECQFKDSMIEQTVYLDSPYTVKSITLKIKDVYKTTEYGVNII